MIFITSQELVMMTAKNLWLAYDKKKNSYRRNTFHVSVKL